MKETEEKILKKSFDLKVTHRDEKTGLVTESDPYILRECAREGGGRQRFWERPAGSGNLFDKSGTPIGRWDKTKPEGQRFIEGEKHIAFQRPLTGDQKLRAEMIAKDVRLAEVERELAAVKAEKEKKDAPKASLSPKKEPGA